MLKQNRYFMFMFEPWQMSERLRALAAVGAPRALLQVVSLLFFAVGEMKPDLDMAEYFAGEMAVPRTF